MSRDRQVRSARVLCFGLASMAPLVGSVAEKLKDSNIMEWSTRRCGPLGVESSVDFVASPWTRTSVVLVGQLVGHHLRHQHSTPY